jgi:hypothetical protein
MREGAGIMITAIYVRKSTEKPAPALGVPVTARVE